VSSETRACSSSTRRDTGFDHLELIDRKAVQPDLDFVNLGISPGGHYQLGKKPMSRRADCFCGIGYKFFRKRAGFCDLAVVYLLLGRGRPQMAPLPMKSLRTIAALPFLLRDLTDRVRANHGQQPSLPSDGTIPNHFTCKAQTRIRRSSLRDSQGSKEPCLDRGRSRCAGRFLFTHWIVRNIGRHYAFRRE